MKIVAIASVKNEQVFLESSVRYWFTFADQIILFDHNSTDGTRAIIEDLMNEYGEALCLFNDQFTMGLTYQQAEVTNAMMRTAFEIYGADLVIPLDADEYPYMPEGGSLREFFCDLSQDACYYAYWMGFAPPQEDWIDPAHFAPLAFTRKKKIPFDKWQKSIVTRHCYEAYHPILTVGNHDFVQEEGKVLPQRVDLSPHVYYAHYMCRGKNHFLSKNACGWLAVYSADYWTPGTAGQYEIACDRILKGEITDDVLAWYSLSSAGMTGETVEEIKALIEEIDPHSMYPKITLKYTQKHIKHKDAFALLLESGISMVELYREQRYKYARDVERLNGDVLRLNGDVERLEMEKASKMLELEMVRGSKTYKMGNVIATPVRLLRRLLGRKT